MFDDLNKGIAYTKTYLELAEYFTNEKRTQISIVFNKWQDLEADFDCIEDAISARCFSEDEVLAYALWRAGVYYAESTGLSTRLAKRCSK